MLGYLIKSRLRPKLLSCLWFKTWAKRVWEAPELLRFLRVKAWKIIKGAKLSPTCILSPNTFHGRPANLEVGEFSCLGRIYVQAHEKVTIGRCVVINDDVKLITGSHSIHSATYDHVFLPIRIDDYAWIASGAIVLQGVRVGRGAVVAAGAVVTRDVPVLAVVAGNPARAIGHRSDVPFSYLPSTWFASITAWVGRNQDR